MDFLENQSLVTAISEVKTILLFFNKKRHILIYMSLYALKQYPISAKTILIGGLGISQPGTFFLHRSPV